MPRAHDDTQDVAVERRLPVSSSEASAGRDGGVASDDDPLATLEDAPALAEGIEPRHGEMFGRYVLLACIGRGGMGLVYSAYDPQLDRRIALKLLRRAEAPDPKARARLLRESRAIARVRHPNVVIVHDAGVIDDRVFIAMELVAGSDLRKWLSDATGTRHHAEVLEIMLQAGRGLAAAHRAGVVHRDFKPGNVLIGDDGLVRVADFGLARSLVGSTDESSDDPSDEHDDASVWGKMVPAARASAAHDISAASLDDVLTRTGATLGTPAYMAPEQHMGGRVDARSDQFAFCVALFEALWGRRPFTADNPIDLMMRVTEGKLDPPPRGTGVPDHVQRAVLRGLSRRAEDRWPDMDALLHELGRDTGRTRIRWGLGFAALGACAALFASAAWRADSAEVCPELQPLADGWKNDLQRSFEQTTMPYAAAVHASVVDAVDVWARTWSHERMLACQATKTRGEQSETLLDLRMACYDRQRRSARAIVEQLVNADPSVVQRAVDSVRHLEPADRCDAHAVLARAPLPDDPEKRAAVEHVAERIDAIRGLWAVGRYEEGLAQAELAVREAESTQHGPSLAEALVQLGVLRDGAGHKREAIEALHRAARAALASADAVVLADAWIHLVWSASQTARAEDALVWADYAEMAIDRLGRPPRAVAELRSAQGNALWSAGRHEEALATIDEALHLHEQENASTSVVSTILVQSANALISLRRLDDAQARLERALAIARALQGDSHPNLGSIHNALGVVAFYRGHLEDALASFEQAYAIQERALGAEHPDVLFSLGNIGNVRQELGRNDEALEAMQRVLELARRAYGDSHRETAMTMHNIASIHQAKGDHARALELYREVLPTREAVHGPDDPYVANTLTGIGEVLVELDRAREAVEPLERALEIREAADPDAKARARTRFALARALHGAGVRGSRSGALADAALAELLPLTGDRVAERHRVEIETWLESLTHRARAPADHAR